MVGLQHGQVMTFPFLKKVGGTLFPQRKVGKMHVTVSHTPVFAFAGFERMETHGSFNLLAFQFCTIIGLLGQLFPNIAQQCRIFNKHRTLAFLFLDRHLSYHGSSDKNVEDLSSVTSHIVLC